MSSSGKYVINYFQFSKGRALPIRVALEVSGFPYEYNEIKGEDFAAAQSDKDKYPFGVLPTATLPDGQHLGETLAILYQIGMAGNLMYKDPSKDAQIMMLLMSIEDCHSALRPLVTETDEAKKKELCDKWMSGKFKTTAECLDRQLAKNKTFAVGDKMTIVDIYIHWWITVIDTGIFPHLPKTLMDAYKNMSRVAQKVNEHPKVKELMTKLC